MARVVDSQPYFFFKAGVLKCLLDYCRVLLCSSEAIEAAENVQKCDVRAHVMSMTMPNNDLEK